MANKTLSKEIYNQLMNGKMINKHILDNANDLQINPLFTEVMDNLAEYRNLFEMIGFDFIVSPDFMYINDSEIESEKKTPLAMKALIMLLVIGHYVNKDKRSPNRIFCAKTGGLYEEDFQKMEAMPDIAEVLEKADITTKTDRDLHAQVVNLLVNRGIMMEKSSSKSYVMTDAGKAFYNDVVTNFDMNLDGTQKEEEVETIEVDYS